MQGVASFGQRADLLLRFLCFVHLVPTNLCSPCGQWQRCPRRPFPALPFPSMCPFCPNHALRAVAKTQSAPATAWAPCGPMRPRHRTKPTLLEAHLAVGACVRFWVYTVPSIPPRIQSAGLRPIGSPNAADVSNPTHPRPLTVECPSATQWHRTMLGPAVLTL